MKHKWNISPMTGIILLVFLFISFSLQAQQDPIYAQYMLNPLAINPAYAGSNNMFNANLQYRTQWAGLDANPTTVNFSSHMSVYRNKAGIGVLAIQDQLGETKNTEFNGVFSYKIPVSKATFSFGLQMGFVRYTNDPSMLTIRQPGDPLFVALSETSFNTGAGVLLKSDRYMVGLSVPRLIPVSVSQGGQSIQLYSQNYYLFGSYVLFISETIRFKPSVLLRGTAGAPFSADLNASLNIKENYTAGLFTRNFKSYGLLLQAYMKGFRFGYVFEMPGSVDSNLNFTTHELSIGFSTGFLGYHDHSLKTF